MSFTALIVADKDQVLALIPDLSIMRGGRLYGGYLDLSAETNTLTLGMGDSHITDYVLFERIEGAEYPNAKIE